MASRVAERAAQSVRRVARTATAFGRRSPRTSAGLVALAFLGAGLAAGPLTLREPAAIASPVESGTPALAAAQAVVDGIVDAGRDVAAATAGVASGVTAPLAHRAIDDGRHLGFDTNVYPGDRAMRAWRASAPYEWVGYYLPAPCHKDPSWSGKRERLGQMGYGTAVIYVGQQTWGRTPRPSSRGAQQAARSTSSCSADLVSGPRGRAEGLDAAAKTAAEGFPRGTIVYLDVERMERTPQAMRDYVRAWTAAVLADGRYVPGVYVHTWNARELYGEVRTAYAAAGVSEEPHFWIASGRGFSPDKTPQATGHAFAAAWQGMLDVVQRWGGVALPIDVNVASEPSPSAHQAPMHVAAAAVHAGVQAGD